MTDKLKEYLLSLGADLVGFAKISMIPLEYRFDMPYAISIGIALNPAIVSLIPHEATIEYLDEYDSVTKKLDNICNAACEYISEKGYHAIPQTVAFVQKQRVQNHTEQSAGKALVPHKTVAALAGLGWISKSSLLITKQYGSAIRFTSLLTNAPIKVLNTKYECRCGDCTICADACPGNAIKNKKWNIDVDRDELIDFYACRKAVKKRGLVLGKDHGTCGICMAVCPYTKKYLSHTV